MKSEILSGMLRIPLLQLNLIAIHGLPLPWHTKDASEVQRITR